MSSRKPLNKITGFTLIEVMMVIVILGFLASAMQFTIRGNSPENRLEKSSERFVAVFNIANDFALLNNLELGLYIGENSYKYLAFDGTRWIDIPDNDALAEHTLPEGMLLTLELDDLPVSEPALIDTLVEVMNDTDNTLFEGTDIGRDEDEPFVEGEDDENEQDQEKQNALNNSQNSEQLAAQQLAASKKQKHFPQIFILSGGEISPFSVEFFFDEFDVETDDLSYKVTGLYSTPLTVSGPLYGGEPNQ